MARAPHNTAIASRAISPASAGSSGRIPPVLRPEHPSARPLSGLVDEFGLEVAIGRVDGVRVLAEHGVQAWRQISTSHQLQNIVRTIAQRYLIQLH